MSGNAIEFDAAKAALAIEALSQGRTPGPIAQSLGLTRATLFQWRASYPEFRSAWEHAIGVAADAIEQVVYLAAMSGDPDAQKMWLKANRPMRFDRRNVLSAMLIQSRLPSLPVDVSADDLMPEATSAPEATAMRAADTDPLSVPLTECVQVDAEGTRADVWPKEFAGAWPRSVVEMVNAAGVTHTVIADGQKVPPDQMADLLALLSAQRVAYDHYNALLREQAMKLAKGGNGNAQTAASAASARQPQAGSDGAKLYRLLAPPLHGGDASPLPEGDLRRMVGRQPEAGRDQPGWGEAVPAGADGGPVGADHCDAAGLGGLPTGQARTA